MKHRFVPRKTKKALKTWLFSVKASDLRPGQRARLLRFFNHERSRNGMGALRRRPDGRVSLLELP
jgi:hypothetical protein